MAEGCEGGQGTQSSAAKGSRGSARLPRRTLHERLSLLPFKARVGFEVCSEVSQGGEIEWVDVEPRASSETSAGFRWAGSEPVALFSLG